jgi:argininosuccinate synthase
MAADRIWLRGRDLHRRSRPGRGAGAGAQEGRDAGREAENIYIEDLREEFVRDFVFPMFRANALYEGLYLLGTSIARPLISKRLVEIAPKPAPTPSPRRDRQGQRPGAVRAGGYALNPDIKVIAPWREWDLTSRTKLIEFAEAHQIPIAKDKRGEAPFSVDANLLHTSSEGKVLEDPAEEAPDYVYQRTVHPEDAPDTPEMVEITFEKGDAVAINGEAMSPATILTRSTSWAASTASGGSTWSRAASSA